MKRRSKEQSEFFQRLGMTQILIDPYELLFRSHHGLPLEVLGVIVRLLPYLANGEAIRLDTLHHFVNLSRRRLKRLWPDLEPFLAVDGEMVRFVLPSWIRVQTITAERQSLRHLFERLVDFWGNACVYCGQESGTLHIEHIVPLARGGTDDLSNLTLACPSCNFKKRTQTAAEFGHPHIHEKATRIQ